MLELQNISKSFPGVNALAGVSFTLKNGEVHALCGENGAGKSTLMNIVTGNLQPDGGTILLDGKPVVFINHQQARNRRIAIVYQERSLVSSLSVAENVFLNHYPVNRFGFIDYKKLYEDTSRVLALLHMTDVDPRQHVMDLSPPQEQMVEIAKALVKDPGILILDEPTASITAKETQTLFEIIRGLIRKGIGVIYISHRLSEIFQIANRVTVLKDGRSQGTFEIDEVNEGRLIRLMVGRSLDRRTFENQSQKSLALKVTNLTGEGFNNISFEVRKGEVVALAGLIGAGRTEIAKTIFGVLQKTSGTIELEGTVVEISCSADAVSRGLAYVPEDRKRQSIFPDMSVIENMLAAKYAGGGLRKKFPDPEATSIAMSFKDRLRIATPSLEKKMRHLSGGSQQKTVLSRWLSLNPRVIMIDEPTQGVDVGSKFEIYDLLHSLAAEGMAILLISSELPEVLTLANRIVVIRKGEVAGVLTREDATEERILELASGFHTTHEQ